MKVGTTYRIAEKIGTTHPISKWLLSLVGCLFLDLLRLFTESVGREGDVCMSTRWVSILSNPAVGMPWLADFVETPLDLDVCKSHRDHPSVSEGSLLGKEGMQDFSLGA